MFLNFRLLWPPPPLLQPCSKLQPCSRLQPRYSLVSKLVLGSNLPTNIRPGWKWYHKSLTVPSRDVMAGKVFKSFFWTSFKSFPINFNMAVSLEKTQWKVAIIDIRVTRVCIFSCVRPFYEWAVSNLERYMNRSLWV